MYFQKVGLNACSLSAALNKNGKLLNPGIDMNVFIVTIACNFRTCLTTVSKYYLN